MSQIAYALNGICPYFTMFPLDFPYQILKERADPGDVVLDPFCGRGTTNYASRILRLTSFGVDASPVAAAISEAKLANTTPSLIMQAAARILSDIPEPKELPAGEFWDWAFHPHVLRTLCRLREGLLTNCRSDTRKALRGVILGALHGPRPKGQPSYLSNQCPRTYAPKPGYATRYWQARDMRPERVDVLEIIRKRAVRYYEREQTKAVGRIMCDDSRKPAPYRKLLTDKPVRWVITSPPFYGMRTYLQDQWLRRWFLGGLPTVDYSTTGQLAHSDPTAYAAQLRQVWRNVYHICSSDAGLVIRFGGIQYRKADPLGIVMDSLDDSGWRVNATLPAGSASRGHRQAASFSYNQKQDSLEEYDIWADRIT